MLVANKANKEEARKKKVLTNPSQVDNPAEKRGKTRKVSAHDVRSAGGSREDVAMWVRESHRAAFC